MERILKAALTVMITVCVQALAADKAPEWKTLDIPKEIVTKQELVKTPESWACTNEAHPSALASVSISEGPPEDGASLVYDNETKHKGKTLATWQFDAAAKDRYWVSCTYSGTVIVLKKQLPEGIKELRVSYDVEVKTDGLPTVEKVEYR